MDLKIKCLIAGICAGSILSASCASTTQNTPVEYSATAPVPVATVTDAPNEPTQSDFPVEATDTGDFPGAFSDVVLHFKTGSLSFPGWVTAQANYDIPLVLNDEVKKWIVYLKVRHHRHFKRWLQRSGAYEKLIKDKLVEAGLPTDLFYLALIESGFSPRVNSHAGAGGIWQFMPRTGKMYKLDQDFWHDQRYDPVGATDAAIKHLAMLYDMFNDWYLAAAGYNAGEYKILRAIKRYDKTDFWELIEEDYLRQETKNYVPKWLAATIIAKHPEFFGFDDIEYDAPWEYETITVPDATDLKVIAAAAGVDAEEVSRLNPQIKRWFTPPFSRYQVRIPAGSLERFEREWKKIPSSKRVTFRHHMVRQGETLSEISAAYDTSVYAIMRLNRIRRASSIRAGADLVVPVRPDFEPPTLEEVRSQQVGKRAKPLKIYNVPGKKLVSYVVGPGDVIGALADRFGVSVAELIKWNELNKRGTVFLGRRIVAYVSPEMEADFEPPTAILEANKKASEKRKLVDYIVRGGDTMWSISMKYSCPLDKIYELNGLNRRSLLHAGDRLVLEVPESLAARVTPAPGATVMLDTAGPSQPLATAKVAQAQPRGERTSYRVRSGDSLWSIAQKFGCDIADLIEWNSLDRAARLYPGTSLTVYQR
jgi:peptidoglycan lytic transglycosylase D